MRCPRECDYNNLKVLGRYLLMVGDLVRKSDVPQTRGDTYPIDVFVDADHQGCVETRRSTTGAVGM
eukprot:11711488-Alexandrium_andersonii.AAC.1